RSVSRVIENKTREARQLHEHCQSVAISCVMILGNGRGNGGNEETSVETQMTAERMSTNSGIPARDFGGVAVSEGILAHRDKRNRRNALKRGTLKATVNGDVGRPPIYARAELWISSIDDDAHADRIGGLLRVAVGSLQLQRDRHESPAAPGADEGGDHAGACLA